MIPGLILPRANSNTFPIDSNTKLLLHMDGTNGSTTFTDSSPSAHTLVATGPTISTANSKFGTASGVCDLTGTKYLSCDGSTDFAFAGDFTIDLWAYLNNLTGAQMFYDSRPAATNGAYLTLFMTSSKLRLFTSAADILVSVSNCPTLSWFHLAVARLGSTIKMFLNGVEEASVTNSTSFLNAASTRPILFNDGFNTTNPLNGYMDEVRVSNVCRWTGGFVPYEGAYGS